VSTEQRENLDAILRQSAFPVGSDVNEQRQLLRELLSAQPLPADVTVTAAELGGVPTAEINRGVRSHRPFRASGPCLCSRVIGQHAGAVIRIAHGRRPYQSLLA
jgi:hypothetical protein